MPSPSPEALPVPPEILPFANEVKALLDFVMAAPAFGLILLCVLFLLAFGRVDDGADHTDAVITLILIFGLAVGINSLFDLRMPGMPSFAQSPNWEKAPIVGPFVRPPEPEVTLSPRERALERKLERLERELDEGRSGR